MSAGLVAQAGAVALGAAVGALLRWGVSTWLNPGGAIPWGTLAVNLVGGYLIGIDPRVCTTLLDARPVQCALAE